MGMEQQGCPAGDNGLNSFGHVNDRQLRLRSARGSDAGVMAALMRRNGPLGTDLAHGLEDLIGGLLEEGYLFSLIAETAQSDQRLFKPVSIVVLAFVTAATRDKFDDRGGAFLGSELLSLAKMHGPARYLIRAGDVGGENATTGLDVFVLKWLNFSYREYDMLSGSGRICLETAYHVMRKAFAGYNIRSIRIQGKLKHEPVYRAAGLQLERTFLAGEKAAYPAIRIRNDRATFSFTREDFVRTPHGSPISRLFMFYPPVLGFTTAEREILELALEGLTNEQIAAQLGVSVSAIKDRWNRIYARADCQVPRLKHDNLDGDATRGSERRRTILAYVQDHPEELRPYSPPPR